MKQIDLIAPGAPARSSRPLVALHIWRGPYGVFLPTYRETRTGGRRYSDATSHRDRWEWSGSAANDNEPSKQMKTIWGYPIDDYYRAMALGLCVCGGSFCGH